jgi:RNA 2',3'-cyclic 3'-phosphodiesterase
VGDERIRLFCALQLADETVDCIAAWQGRELRAAAGRVVPPENLHITLAFLGSRPAGEVPAIAEALREAARAAQPPAFVFHRYRETPRVGMLALEEVRVSHAASFAYDLQERFEGLGIPLRERPVWKPHITVIRFRERAGLSPAPPNTCSIRVVRSALYRSVLGPGLTRNSGAQYQVVETAPLGGR